MKNWTRLFGHIFERCRDTIAQTEIKIKINRDKIGKNREKGIKIKCVLTFHQFSANGFLL